MASWQFISWTFISHLYNRQNTCWKLKPNNPSHSCWDIQLATTTTNLIVNLEGAVAMYQLSWQSTRYMLRHFSLEPKCWTDCAPSIDKNPVLTTICLVESTQASLLLSVLSFFLSGAYFTRWFPAPWPEASPAAKCLPAPFTLIFPVVSGRSWLQQCKVPHRQKG